MRKLSRFFGLVLCLALFFSVTAASASAASTSFNDVPTSHWAYESITTAAEQGFVNGDGNGGFNPEGTVTYAEFMSMLTKAFYPNDIPAATPGGAWYDPVMTAAKNAGMLKNVPNVVATNNIQRSNMALVMYNIMTAKGKPVYAGDRTNATTQIKDWYLYSGGTAHTEAIPGCYAVGIITGYSDGEFHGGDTMTRAQACVVILRLEEYLNGTLEKPNITPPETPITGHTDTLANGKPVTEENVLAILAELEREWPDGTSWGYGDEPGTNYYVAGPGKDVANGIQGMSLTFACGGYAAMISDSIFGREGHPVRKLTDVTQTRPGDIVIFTDVNGVADHVMIATTRVTMETMTYHNLDGTKTTNTVPYVHVTDGNHGLEVCWPSDDNPYFNYHCLVNEPYTGIYPIVYTRYPD